MRKMRGGRATVKQVLQGSSAAACGPEEIAIDGLGSSPAYPGCDPARDLPVCCRPGIDRLPLGVLDRTGRFADRCLGYTAAAGGNTAGGRTAGGKTGRRARKA